MTKGALLGLIFLMSIFIGSIYSNQLTSLSKGEELKQIHKLKLEIDLMKKNLTQFYNYSIICGGKRYEARADQTFSDRTIPQKFQNFVLETYLKPENRANKCPRWSYNVETLPRSGGMESLLIPENTKIGHKVYLLLALDPESQPLYYFIRRAESETEPDDDPDDVIFKVNVIKMGNSWIGEVILDKELDYEKKQSYNYLAYAYDGVNLLEKYSTVEITDVDDEKPEIITQHPNYNLTTKQFEFKIFENTSIGEVINPNLKIEFQDTDTQNSQLHTRLTNYETGIADSPFSLNNHGELRLVSNLDFETQKEHVLLLTVSDTAGGFSEQLIKIQVIDVPDLPPKFIEPRNMMIDTDRKHFNPNFILNKQFVSMDEGYVLFYENKVGHVFDILALSANNEPLGDIKYELLEDSTQMSGFFEIKKHSKNNTWYLDCIVPITLENQEEKYLHFKIRAIESANEPNGKNFLFTDKHVTVKVINGDMCLPVFDKELYEFEVVENVRQLLEPIYVSDCDHGLNGKINLSTTNKDFSFKLDQVYRYSKLGLYMAKAYDYEQNITANGHIIEFEIIARGNEKSLNKYETRSLVRITILDLNEFKPRFVLPAPAFFLKDGIPTEQQQRIFLYNVLEGQDFLLDVRAEDQDKGGDGELFYSCRYLHPDDTFEIIQKYNSTINLFNIRIPGRYFDSTSKIPITFAVFVQDSMDDLTLRSEIIIYLRPQSAEQKAAFFEFSEYEFKLKESSSQNLRLKLINENLSASKIKLEELSDPLNLFSPEFEETWISKKDMITILENESLALNEPEQEVNSDLFVILYPTDSSRDFDQLFLDNNKSDIYQYKLRAKLAERSDLYNDVTINVKLIDLNDNKPELININLLPNQPMSATLEKNFYQHTLININNTHFIPKVQDNDFSDEFGLKSLYCRVNDTRFYLDNEHMSAELEHQFSSVSILVRVLASPDSISNETIWLNVTCEDNYFNRKSVYNTNWFPIQLNLIEPENSIFFEVFNKTEYVLNVDENWIGPLAHIGNFLPNVKINYKIDGLNNDQTILLNQHFYMDNNQLILREPFDYENSDKIYNFTITANVNENLVFRTNVIVLINDINDEMPKMSQNELSVVLNQNHRSKGQVIANLFATDLDKQDFENGLKFETNSDKITLNKVATIDKFLHGVEIILAEDFVQESYEFHVSVTDSNSQSDKCHIIIIAKNEQIYDELNWSEPEYQTTLRENTPTDTVFLTVNVVPVGLKSPVEVKYKIVGQNPFYEINEITGEIKTSNFKIDRENPSTEQKFKQSTFFVQAFLMLDSKKYWSNIQPVYVKIEDQNDELPIFVQPSTNLTTITALTPHEIYQFQAIDLDKDDTVVYALVEQSLVSSKSEINLPFRIDTKNGSLSFNISELTNDDYLTLLKQDSEFSRIKLVVQAEDSDGKKTHSALFVDLSIKKLTKRSDKAEHLTPIVYRLEPKTDQIKRINDSKYTIEESVPENTIIADLGSFIIDHKLPLSDSFKIESLNDTLHNPELYFRYDYENSNLKLIRRLDHDLANNLSLVLVTEDNFRVRFDFDILDVNDKIPELEMDEQEINKFGQNLIVVSVDSLEDYLNSITKTVSSTPKPPRKPIPAMPELGLPERPLQLMPYITRELDKNRDLLLKFDNTDLIKTYKILDTDKNNKFEVKFDLNGTSEQVARSYSLSVNGTHVLVEKNSSISPEDQAVMEENLQNRFRIELSDGKNKNFFNGEVYRIDARQLQRLSTYVPRNGRYQAELYRSAMANTKISLNPLIQIENPFPYDIFVNLTGKLSHLFNYAPKMIQSTSNVNFGPTEILLSLNKSLEEHEDDLVGSTSIDLSLDLYTKNDYLNTLMDVIGRLKISIDLKNENKHQPRIAEVLPNGRVIELDEGVYLNKEIASIKAYDRDKGDPGRIEYFLIGNSNLLKIDEITGKVYLNGTLDAEAEQLIVFFCYARDLAPAPFGRNSELQRFEIQIRDVNEFTPVIQPGLSSLTLKEATFDSENKTFKVVDDFRFDCYDRDLDSDLEIRLTSIQYVSKHDTLKLLDVPKLYSLSNLFRLVYQNSSSQNYKSALLAYTSNLDYEKLFRPNETLIRIDVSCSDSVFESMSKLIVKVEDENDNAPKFTDKNLVINKDESNLLESIARIEASDNDLSAQYGNQSLKYKINKCNPNTFDIFIDERTGEISSKLLLDFDTEEVIKTRTQIFNNELSYVEQLDFFNNFNRFKCEIIVQDSGLYGTPSNLSLSDTMNLTIVINNINDNPPDIRLDKQSENLIEVKEGEQTRGAILQKISVFDKDGASNLECVFGTGLKTSDPFELRTSLDAQDPHITWCILKVRDDMIVDYDIVKKSYYLLELVVTDNIPTPVYPNRGVSRAQIRIRVIPVNNKPPRFVNGNEETFNVLDSIRPNTLIGTILATDMENPNPDRIIYKFDTFLPRSLYNKFELRQNQNSTSSYWGSVGIFTTQTLLVSESPYILTIIAYDGPLELKDTLSSRKIIRINVLNKGSMSVWINETNGQPVDFYTVDLEEEQPENTPFLTVKANIPNANNKDLFDSNYVTYSILDENNTTNPYYTIDAKSGVLQTTNKTIDFEKMNQVDLVKQMRNVKVRATSSDGLFSYSTHVSINIIDINDNKPKFEFSNYKFCVVENSTEQSVFGIVRAFDLDHGSNAIVKYKVKDENNFVQIDEVSGELKTLNPSLIDREVKSFFNIKVIAYDIDELEDELDLEICVLDINDNRPVFDSDTLTEHQIEENTNEFKYRLKASDLDFSHNGTVYFYFDDELNSNEITQKFRIEPMSGLVELITPLDYEAQQEYNLLVTCSDNGNPVKLKSNLNIKIKVIDLNDNKPKFSAENNVRIFVNEALKSGQIITKLNVTDLDISEQFSDTKLEILSVKYLKSNNEYSNLASSIFTINSNGEISLGHGHNLDYQKYREYLIEVKAVDSDRPELNDLFKLSVSVKPSNDKKPVFEHFSGGSRHTTLYRKSLAESRDNDYVIDIVKATDPNNHGVRYYLDSVVELDANNNTKSIPDDLFTVGLEDGAVKTRKKRSFYSGDSYILNIRAVSKLNETLSSTTTLIVKIDSDSDSLFEERVIEIFLDENSPGNKFITQLKPKDVAHKLKYSLNNEFSSPQDLYFKWFEVDLTTGVVTTKSDARIDAEQTDEVLLSVDVLDEEKDNVIENLIVKIIINDLNDNYPIFESGYNYEPSILEDDNTTIQIERFVTKLKAFDLDRTANNSNITYEIEKVTGLSMDAFRLDTDPTSGEVKIIKTKGTNLDRDLPSIGSTIRIKIRAQNTYNSAIRTSKEILLNLFDLNDNAPTFYDKSDVQLSLSEDEPVGSKFYQIKALDIDDGLNAQLAYEIKPKSGIVEIDSEGFLYLIRPLDYELNKELNFSIVVKDKSSKPLSASKKVSIKILNVNDNEPKFDDLPKDDQEHMCSLSLVENMPSGKLFRVEASDADFPINPTFSFSLSSLKTLEHKTRSQIALENDLFKIDQQSGDLFLIGDLDREKFDNYILEISAKDQEINGVYLKSSVECFIKVLDENDNRPEFLPSIQREYKILPIVNERTLIGYFAASDPDLGSNGSVIYTIKNNYQGIFEINSESYLFLNLKKMSDKNHDLHDLYELQIMAQDLGTPHKLDSTFNIKVRIDSNYFSFDQQNTDRLEIKTPDFVDLDENSESGTKIGYARVLNSFDSIISEQNSKSKNRQVKLRFKLLTCNDTFMIDENSGLIDVKDSRKLDYELIKEFVVTVEAIETQVMSSFSKVRTGTSSFIVKLRNLNDNPVSFSQEVYEVNMNENQKTVPFDLNLLITLIDPDLDSPKTQAINQLNPIELKLSGLEASSFRLSKISPFVYKIKSFEHFDYEIQRKYEFLINAWDGLFRSSAKLIVNIVDENDNRPIFDQKTYEFIIDENSPMNTHVGFVKAIDLDKSDEHNQIVYKITNSHENIFTINENSGLISVRDSFKLDREKIDSFNLTILAFNPGKPEFFDTAMVTIRLNDLNDESPKFDEPVQRVNIREKVVNLPRYLARVHAGDNDLGLNGTVEYFISSVNDRSYQFNTDFNDNTTLYYIDKNSGALFLNFFLNADSPSVEKSYEIRITARDMGGNSDDCFIFVNLIDINDQAPLVTSPVVNEFIFAENSAIDLPLFEVKAYDPDYRQSIIRYSLDKDPMNDWKNFEIDPNSGHVYSVVNFDYETKNEFNLRIICTDSGIMIREETEENSKTVNDLERSMKLELTTEYRVKIMVIDLDDNEPEFNYNQTFKANVSENLDIGSLVTILPLAFDRDSLPENNQIKYFIIDGQTDGKFSLNESTGEIFLMDELERKERDTYDITIQATSKDQIDPDVQVQEKSLLKVQLIVVKDKLFIEFDEQEYYLSVQLQDSDTNSSTNEQRMYKFEDLRHQQSGQFSLDMNAFRKSAIFYAKSHLIKRKIKRVVKFKIEMLQIIRHNEKILTKLPNHFIAHSNHSDVFDQMFETNFDSKLFVIDETNGKVYINKVLAQKENYKIGDRFVITLSAWSPSQYSDETENTVTQLTIRLTDKDYSFIMPLKSHDLQDIMFKSLNPLKPKYIPRMLQADGVKVAIQDLLSSKSSTSNLMKYSLVIQVEAKQEKKNLDLDLFLKIWKNFSPSKALMNEFDHGFIDPRPLQDRIDDTDIFSIYKPFYSSWLFWLLFLIGCLLIIILIFFVFCLRQNHKNQKISKKPGIIIEYPPGVNPIYNDGVLSLNNNARPNSVKRKVVPVEIDNSPATIKSDDRYEEKEFRIDFDDEEEV